ncbi:dual specificity phosphatase 28 [Lontra canadensis]|uniref:dual specificity phosphatase 28 n=1 Tax=Lontra canadensis TaxID=76717 RepID=UPI0013F3345C|nr:dual specificity phosphatase 28 [Lontra canadensis]
MDPGPADRREVPGVASPAPPPFVCVAPSLFLGTARAAAAPELLARAGVTLCVNVSRQQPGPCAPGVVELRVPVFDDPAEDLLAHLEPTCAAMEAAVRAGGACLVYCKNGRSRSAAVCTAYLMRHRGLSLAGASQVVKSARPVAEPNPGFWTQLQKYEEALQSLPRLSMEPSGPCSGTGGDELQNEP